MGRLGECPSQTSLLCLRPHLSKELRASPRSRGSRGSPYSSSGGRVPSSKAGEYRHSKVGECHRSKVEECRRSKVGERPRSYMLANLRMVSMPIKGSLERRTCIPPSSTTTTSSSSSSSSSSRSTSKRNGLLQDAQ